MADEIKVQMTLACSKDNFTLPKHGAQKSYDQTDAGFTAPVFTATMAGVDVTLTGITNIGFVKLVNTDLVNNIQWGPFAAAAFHPIGLLRAGREAIFEFNAGSVLHLKAVTGTAKIMIIAVSQ